jgi:hypothetical protein
VTQPNSDAGGAGGGQPSGGAARVFTQEELDRAVEARLARERKKFADYDDLKAKVEAQANADQENQSKLDKVLQDLAAEREARAKADHQALLSSVKATTGLSDRQVSKLEGNSVDDLLADATETFGWKPKSEGDNGSGEGDGQRRTSTASRPPREKLTPNPGVNKEPEEMDPIKLAEMIPRF